MVHFHSLNIRGCSKMVKDPPWAKILIPIDKTIQSWNAQCLMLVVASQVKHRIFMQYTKLQLTIRMQLKS